MTNLNETIISYNMMVDIKLSKIKSIYIDVSLGLDINELSPIYGGHAYDFLVARLVYKILNYNLISQNKVNSH